MAPEQNSSGKILDAALRLFAERGYEATSTREICERAGIKKPTLYYFFQSKEGVYRAILRNAMKEFQEIAETSLQAPGPLRARMKVAVERIFQDANRRPSLWRLIYAVAHSLDSPFASDLHQPYLDINKELGRGISAAARSGEIRGGNVEVRLLVLIGTLGEAICNSLVFDEPKLTRKLAHSIIDTVFDGWLPRKTRN